jgi:hypothetical protein
VNESKTFLYYLLRTFPSVEKLILDFSSKLSRCGAFDRILDLLGSCKMEKLEFLEFSYAKMNGEQWVKFMLEIVPRFPNLESVKFDAPSCRSSDFRILANRLRNEKTCLVSKILLVSTCHANW